MINQIVEIITVQQHPPPKKKPHSIPLLKNLMTFRPMWIPREVTLPGLCLCGIREHGALPSDVQSLSTQCWRWSRALSLHLHIPTSSQSPMDNDWGEKPCRKQLSRAIYLDLVCSEVNFFNCFNLFCCAVGLKFSSFDYYLKKKK